MISVPRPLGVQEQLGGAGEWRGGVGLPPVTRVPSRNAKGSEIGGRLRGAHPVPSGGSRAETARPSSRPTARSSLSVKPATRRVPAHETGGTVGLPGARDPGRGGPMTDGGRRVLPSAARTARSRRQRPLPGEIEIGPCPAGQDQRVVAGTDRIVVKAGVSATNRLQAPRPRNSELRPRRRSRRGAVEAALVDGDAPPANGRQRHLRFPQSREGVEGVGTNLPRARRPPASAPGVMRSADVATMTMRVITGFFLRLEAIGRARGGGRSATAMAGKGHGGRDAAAPASPPPKKKTGPTRRRRPCVSSSPPMKREIGRTRGRTRRAKADVLDAGRARCTTRHRRARSTSAPSPSALIALVAAGPADPGRGLLLAR